jgi:hypothetical protein
VEPAGRLAADVGGVGAGGVDVVGGRHGRRRGVGADAAEGMRGRR